MVSTLELIQMLESLDYSDVLKVQEFVTTRLAEFNSTQFFKLAKINAFGDVTYLADNGMWVSAEQKIRTFKSFDFAKIYKCHYAQVNADYFVVEIQND